MAYASNVTVAYFPAGARRTVTHEIYQYAYGQKLILDGLDLPVSYQVDFSNYREKNSAIQQIGDEDGVPIPDNLLTTGKPVFAFLILHAGENDGATEYTAEIPVRLRPEPSDDVPTPTQQSAIDEAIIALNAGVESAQASAEDSEAWAVGERDGEPVESSDPTHENNAKFYAGEAAGSAEDSEAWAVGQRGGVDVEQTDETYQNNSKYWAEQANVRGQAKATLAESWAVGGTGTRTGEDTDNAKYYAQLAAQGAEESGYAWFDVNDTDGHLYIYISDNLSEDVSFSVVEATGHLEVTYT